MSRPQSKIRLGYFPLPVAEAARIRRQLILPSGFAALDPCIGDGSAVAKLTEGAIGYRYGIELDAFRAEQARARVHEVIQGSCFDVHCPVESLSLLYLNPPYDFEISDGKPRRLELVFLEHTWRWLKPGGIVVLVIPCERLAECGQVLAWQFRETKTYALTEPECRKYKQVVVFAIRRSRRERERLTDREVARVRMGYCDRSRSYEQLLKVAPLPENAVSAYALPAGGAVSLVYRGLPLDEIEDVLPKSPAYRQAARLLCPESDTRFPRPLTPLHGGHVGLLAASGMLNGVFGFGDERHIAAWQSEKAISYAEEEEEDGRIVKREREYFVHTLNVVFSDGRFATLGTTPPSGDSTEHVTRTRG